MNALARKGSALAPMKGLALKGVAVRFGKVEALAGVDVDVGAGEIVMLAGPNGAGKSTLIRVLLGLVRATRGTLEVNGKPQSVNNNFKRQLGYLPEAVAFADNLSGRQVLRFFASARGVKRARVKAVLEQVGLAHAARRAVRGYSRGMRQRLGLGLAILAEPPLLILDEPTGGLDQEGLGVLWSVLDEWRARGRQVFMASHDLTLLERHVDRICLLRAGKVCAFDTPARLREQAGLPIRVELELAPEHERAPAFIEALGEAEHTIVAQDAQSLAVEIDGSELLAVMDLRQRFAGVVTGVRVIEPGLDLVYGRLLEEAA